MTTHTTYFCDGCNSDWQKSHGDDAGHAISHEYPLDDGWAELEKPYVNTLGHDTKAQYHVCAHCLASPDFDQRQFGEVASWDTASRENVAAGALHAERYGWAYENLGAEDRWGRTGVRQVFGESPYGHQVGPKLKDGAFKVVKHDWEIAMDKRRAEWEATHAA